LAKNCCPICKNSTVAKRLTDAFRNVIDIQQHGFTKGKSTISNLLAFTKNIYESYNDNCQLDAIYTDFSKPFDSVNHRALIFKPIKLG
jgi:hypothetical protein